MTPPVVVPSQSEIPDWLRETIAPVDPTPSQISEPLISPVPPQTESQSNTHTDTTHTDLDVLMDTLTPHQ